MYQFWGIRRIRRPSPARVMLSQVVRTRRFRHHVFFNDTFRKRALGIWSTIPVLFQIALDIMCVEPLTLKSAKVNVIEFLPTPIGYIFEPDHVLLERPNLSNCP